MITRTSSIKFLGADASSAEHMAGYEFVDMIETPHGVLPLYRPSARTDGRPDIDTLEGWNLLRYESAERQVSRKLGRAATREEVFAQLAENDAFAYSILPEARENG